MSPDLIAQLFVLGVATALALPWWSWVALVAGVFLMVARARLRARQEASNDEARSRNTQWAADAQWKGEGVTSKAQDPSGWTSAFDRILKEDADRLAEAERARLMSTPLSDWVQPPAQRYWIEGFEYRPDTGNWRRFTTKEGATPDQGEIAAGPVTGEAWGTPEAKQSQADWVDFTAPPPKSMRELMGILFPSDPSRARQAEAFMATARADNELLRPKPPPVVHDSHVVDATYPGSLGWLTSDDAAKVTCPSCKAVLARARAENED